MAKDDVVGVAFYADDQVVRLQLDDGKDGEVPGDVVVWRSKDDDPANSDGHWCEPKPEDEITAEDRLIFRGAAVPGKRLSKQPPQVPAVLPVEVILEGIASKAAAYVSVHNSPRTAIAYLEDRVATGFLPAEHAGAIADELGLSLILRAPRPATEV
jgi:hypothetical protein